MLKQLDIENFRRFRYLSIPRLDRICLFVGPNNVGKTSILEAAFLLAGKHNPHLPLVIDTIRGKDSVVTVVEDIWGWLFPEKQLDLTMKIRGLDEKKNWQELLVTIEQQTQIEIQTDKATIEDGSGRMNEQLCLKYKISGDGFSSREMFGSVLNGKINYSNVKYMRKHSAIYMGARAPGLSEEHLRRFDEIKRKKDLPFLLSVLQKFDSRIADVSLTFSGSSFGLMVDVGFNEYIPAWYLGDGIKRIIPIITDSYYLDGGILLVDEVDRGIHYSGQAKLWNAIDTIVQETSTQVMATTHSTECLKACFETFSKKPKYPLSVYRLEESRDGTDVMATEMDHDAIEFAIKNGIEMRGS